MYGPDFVVHFGQLKHEALGHLLSLGMVSFTSSAQSRKGGRVSAVRLAGDRNGAGEPLRSNVKETLEATTWVKPQTLANHPGEQRLQMAYCQAT